MVLCVRERCVCFLSSLLINPSLSHPPLSLTSCIAADATNPVSRIHRMMDAVSGCSLPEGVRKSASSASGSGDSPRAACASAAPLPTDTLLRRSSGSGKSRLRSMPAALARDRTAKPSGLRDGARWRATRSSSAATRASGVALPPGAECAHTYSANASNSWRPLGSSPCRPATYFTLALPSGEGAAPRDASATTSRSAPLTEVPIE